MSASKPLMRCRNSKVDVKTGVLCWSRDKHGGSLLTGRAASGTGKRFDRLSGRFRVQEVLSEGMVNYTKEDPKVSDLRQNRRLEILSGSKPLGPPGDFCIDLMSAIALISLSQHDLLFVGKRARFYGFSY
jgi:hypothetical protein